MFLPNKILEEKLRRILAEDVGQGDITTALLVPARSIAEAEITAKDTGVAAGIEETSILLRSLGLEVDPLVSDGEKIRTKQKLMKIRGETRTILAAERTVLNILSRMSGIATATNRLVEKLRKAKRKTKVACTRKTAPGLMYFDKKAVMLGGGDTHRVHLDDLILIKDNHITVSGDVEKAVKKAQKNASFSKKIEVEVSNVEDALAAMKAGADIVMLDNFSPKQVQEAMKQIEKNGLSGRALIEVSGRITADNILDFASKHVDIVSLGEITHSAEAFDISLGITKIENAHGKI